MNYKTLATMFDVIRFSWGPRAIYWTTLILATHSLNSISQNLWSFIPTILLEDSMSLVVVCVLGVVPL